jgi:shikimate kinase
MSQILVDKPIFILGMPASGKSTMGAKMARLMGLKSEDLDKFIEKNEKKSIADLFVYYGEEGFRELERMYLRKLAQNDASVISTGGGAPIYRDNMDYMNDSGMTIFLNVELTILQQRILGNNRFRPMFVGLDESQVRLKLLELWNKRKEYYQKSMVEIKPSGCQENEKSFDNQYLTLFAFLKKNVVYFW